MASGSEIDYLISLQAVRERSAIVLEAAKQGQLTNFEYDESRMSDAARFVVDVISRDFGPDAYDEIPPHGRWQHFDVGDEDRITPLSVLWGSQGCDKLEITRRLVDLFMISVLLDAGAGHVWAFTEPNSDDRYGKSEGIAVASLYMFKAGAFRSEGRPPHTVDGKGLLKLDEATFNKFFQISAENPMVGVQPRVKLLNQVGSSLLTLPDIFGPEGRPGNLVDYLLKSSKDNNTIDYAVLWSTLQNLLLPAWPKDRTHIEGKPIGDAWPLEVLARKAQQTGDSSKTSNIQPFHKLTQWLGYSLMVPFTRVLGLKWLNEELGTGLPEYRNGGVFIDLKVLRLKDEVLKKGQDASGEELPKFSATSDVVVEWRAMTVALLDELYKIISEEFAKKGVKLSMAQMLEAGSWKSGRELAKKLRPQTMSSPILLDSDGTLF